MFFVFIIPSQNFCGFISAFNLNEQTASSKQHQHHHQHIIRFGGFLTSPWEVEAGGLVEFDCGRVLNRKAALVAVGVQHSACGADSPAQALGALDERAYGCLASPVTGS